MIIDLTNDTGFEKFAEIAASGKIDDIDINVDLDTLIQKQAYAEDELFADVSRRMFSVASKEEAMLSARYAEKCASELPEFVKSRINEACLVYGIEPIAQQEPGYASVKIAEEEGSMNKYAGVTEYGTELSTCLAARALIFPDLAEEIMEVQKLAKTITASEMVDALAQIDEYIGADTPWIQNKVGSPEYAVFEKRASGVSVDLNGTLVSFEKLAECEDALNNAGLEIDFDSADPYTIKLAFEELPAYIKDGIAGMVEG